MDTQASVEQQLRAHGIKPTPQRLEIVQNSSRHGVGIFADDPGLQPMILEWLAATL